MPTDVNAGLHVSKLRPNDVDLTPGQRWSIRCPDCDRWRGLKRSQITTHCPDQDCLSAGCWSRCPGSGRRVVVDLTPEEWKQREIEAAAWADALRAGARPIPRMPDRLAS